MWCWFKLQTRRRARRRSPACRHGRHHPAQGNAELAQQSRSMPARRDAASTTTRHERRERRRGPCTAALWLSCHPPPPFQRPSASRRTAAAGSSNGWCTVAHAQQGIFRGGGCNSAQSASLGDSVRGEREQGLGVACSGCCEGSYSTHVGGWVVVQGYRG
jgi:hypothetical protein